MKPSYPTVLPASPPVRTSGAALARGTPRWPVSGLAETTRVSFPAAGGHQWMFDTSGEPEDSRPLTVAGAAQVGARLRVRRSPFLIPVELPSTWMARASTNAGQFTVRWIAWG